jgi:hypothetical protein
MNVLKAIIERLNQKLDASNLFPSLYGIAAPDPNNAKSFLAYDGNGQNLLTADYDKTDGTCFWTLRSAVSVRKADAVQVVACQDMYVTTFPLRAYTVIKKTALQCDSNATEGYVMDMFWKYVQGKDTALRSNIGVTDIYFRPVSVSPNTPDLPKQFEYVTLYFDLDVEVTAQLIEGCYDECGVNPIPLPDGSCPPINRVVSVTGLDTDNTDPSRPIVKISVDGTTITGEGTPDDPLVAIGGGGGGSLRVQDEGTTVTNAATTLNFTGNVTASLASAGNVTVNVPAETPQVNADWNASSGVAEILNKPSIPAAQVNSDWNAVSGVAEILNKPSIPAAQIQSDWNQANNAAVDFIKNKPTIPSTSGLVPYTGATQDVDLGANGLTTHDLTVSHPSGSGVAASITKGGNGEALTVVKLSGSGNAASITGGVTLIDELHLNTDLADAYIASAATWNAKQAALSAGTGISLASNTVTNTAPDQTVVINAGAGIGVTGTYPNFTIDNTVNGFVRNEYTASGAATLDIPIPSGYSYHKIIIVDFFASTANAELWMRVGTGSPSSIQSGASDYTHYRSNFGVGQTFITGGAATDSKIVFVGAAMPTGASGRVFEGEINCFSPDNAIYNKSFKGTYVLKTNAGNLNGGELHSSYNANTALTSLRFLCSTGNINGKVIIQSYL